MKCRCCGVGLVPIPYVGRLGRRVVWMHSEPSRCVRPTPTLPLPDDPVVDEWYDAIVVVMFIGLIVVPILLAWSYYS